MRQAMDYGERGVAAQAPAIVREVWGDKVVTAFAHWVDEMIRKQIVPGQTLQPLAPARKRAMIQAAPSFLPESLGEKGVGQLMDWVYERVEKWVEIHPEEAPGNQ